MTFAEYKAMKEKKEREALEKLAARRRMIEGNENEKKETSQQRIDSVKVNNQQNEIKKDEVKERECANQSTERYFFFF